MALTILFCTGGGGRGLDEICSQLYQEINFFLENTFATVVFSVFAIIVYWGGAKDTSFELRFVSEIWVVFGKLKNGMKFRFSLYKNWISRWRRKSSSNLIGGFQISRAHLKIFWQILLATTKIRLCEIICFRLFGISTQCEFVEFT